MRSITDWTRYPFVFPRDIESSLSDAVRELLDGINPAICPPPEKAKRTGVRSKTISSHFRLRTGETLNSRQMEALSNRLRRDVQIALRSPTNVRKFSPARRVAILGAGASIEDGERHLKTEQIGSSILKDSEINVFLKERLPWTLKTKNIEDVLSALRVMEWSGLAHRYCDNREVSDVVKAILKRYRDHVREHTKKESDRDKTNRKFLGHFGRSKKWAIISFNQDLVVERAAQDVCGWEPVSARQQITFTYRADHAIVGA